MSDLIKMILSALGAAVCAAAILAALGSGLSIAAAIAGGTVSAVTTATPVLLCAGGAAVAASRTGYGGA